MTKTEVEVSDNSEIVHVGAQHNVPTLWIEHDDDKLYKKLRVFHLYGTGHPIEPHRTHVGSVLVHNDSLVLHVYEEK